MQRPEAGVGWRISDWRGARGWLQSAHGERREKGIKRVADNCFCRKAGLRGIPPLLQATGGSRGADQPLAPALATAWGPRRCRSPEVSMWSQLPSQHVKIPPCHQLPFAASGRFAANWVNTISKTEAGTQTSHLFITSPAQTVYSPRTEEPNLERKISSSI